MIAAGALLYWWQSAKQAKEEAIAFADGLDKLNGSMKSMSNTQLRGAIADANIALKGQQEAVSDLTGEIKISLPSVMITLQKESNLAQLRSKVTGYYKTPLS